MTIPQNVPLTRLHPMLLTNAAIALDDDGWIYELKYDGYRALVQCGNSVGIQSRNGHDMTRRYPEICLGLSSVLKGHHVIDGEICVLDLRGRPDFNALQMRSKATRRAAPEIASTHRLVFVAFDLLVERGQSVMDLDLLERKRRLRRLLSPQPPALLLASWVEGRQGRAFYAAAVAQKLEGIVGKRLGSTYQPGIRSPDWIKVKRPGVHKDGWKREPYEDH